MKQLFSIILAVIIIISALPTVYAAETNTVILYTNDVHCAIEDYAVLAAYKAQLEAEGDTVILVDAGDAIQGEVIGTLTDGEAVVDIMNTVGYDYAVPGNHEYDYGIETLFDIADDKAQYVYISSNFYYLPGVRSVFEPYAIEDIGDYQIAFVGITTPETISKANPEYFKDENKNIIYGFPTWDMQDGVLYENVQESVDAAVKEGADIVVAIGHLGIQETTDGWKSTDVIANTDGIDYFIDAHSHETIEKAEYKNKSDEAVALSSTGTKFANFGQLTIEADGTAEFELINPDDVDVETLSADAKAAYNTVKAKIDSYNDEIEYLYEVIGTSEAELIAYDDDNSWAVRKRETNAGDFVADAYRAVTGADIALCNGGGIRNEIAVGDVTRKMLMDMNPWGNSMCVLEISGQQLIDVLEHGARTCPESLGGFFQVSGVTFEIHTYRDTPVITDVNGNFESIDETMERRVENVLVDGEPVELDAKYTVAGTQYVLTSGGDGLTMLEDARVVQQDGLLCDSEMLIKYLDMLGDNIPADKYGNADGDSRIDIVETAPDSIEYDYEIKYGESPLVTVEPGEEGINVKFVPEKTSKYIFRTESVGVDTGAYLFGSDGEEICVDYQDDTTESNDFRLEYEFEAGEIYCLQVFTYSENTETFYLVVECGHNFEDGTCGGCGEACDHTEISFLGYCLCGEIFLGKDINDGDETELELESSDDIAWFRFTPEVSGTYSFKSVSQDCDPDCFMYDASGEWIADSYDENGRDFDLIYYFEAGETYYFDVHNCCGEGSFNVVISRLTHIADDGSTHDVEFAEGEYSNCTEHGYSDGLYCSICDKYVSGHEKLPLDEYYHIDDDGDENCDLCGKEDIYNCGCICHIDNGFLKFIWTIANFIHSLLGISPVCDCGDSHY